MLLKFGFGISILPQRVSYSIIVTGESCASIYTLLSIDSNQRHPPSLNLPCPEQKLNMVRRDGRNVHEGVTEIMNSVSTLFCKALFMFSVTRGGIPFHVLLVLDLPSGAM